MLENPTRLCSECWLQCIRENTRYFLSLAKKKKKDEGTVTLKNQLESARRKPNAGGSEWGNRAEPRGEAGRPSAPLLHLPCRSQPGLGASNLRFQTRRLPLGPRLKRRLRGQAKHRLLDLEETLRWAPVGVGPARPGGRPPGPPQGHLCLLRAGRVTLEGDGLPLLVFIGP